MTVGIIYEQMGRIMRVNEELAAQMAGAYREYRRLQSILAVALTEPALAPHFDEFRQLLHVVTAFLNATTGEGGPDGSGPPLTLPHG